MYRMERGEGGILRVYSRVFDLEASDLLERLRKKGIRLSLDSDGKTVLAWGAIDDEIRQQIRMHRPGLIELIGAGEGDWLHVAEFDCQGDWVQQLDEAMKQHHD